MLAKLKFLRGTRFDLFAYSQERQLELQDLEEYQADLDTILAHTKTDNYGHAVALAEIAGKLRGYGHVKAHNRDAIREERET